MRENKSLFNFCNCIKCGNLEICKYVEQFKTEVVGYNPEIDIIKIDIICKKFREQTTIERGVHDF